MAKRIRPAREEMKWCTVCDQEKLRSEFHKAKGHSDGLQSRCKECQVEVTRQYRAAHPEHVKRLRDEHARRYRHEVKQRAMDGYGGKCSCCGETELAFLTLDHINNDGAAHRKELGYAGGQSFYHWVIKNDFPSLLQVLCWNCNEGRRFNDGVCPHRR
jgi:hypothetical protein